MQKIQLQHIVIITFPAATVDCSIVDLKYFRFHNIYLQGDWAQVSLSKIQNPSEAQSL